ESMEPTIANGSIVLVKQVDELSNGDVGIFSVDGEIMCKRYCINGADIILKSDNQSGVFSDIDVSGAECLIRGKVIFE
ncbi:MAG: S24 family peptidase, partial [Kiritimatiellia bacterium]